MIPSVTFVGGSCCKGGPHADSPALPAHGLDGRCTGLPHVSPGRDVFTWEVSLAQIPRLVILENPLGAVFTIIFISACLNTRAGWSLK